MSIPLTFFGQGFRLNSRLTVKVTRNPYLADIKWQNHALIINSSHSELVESNKHTWGLVIGWDSLLPQRFPNHPVILLKEEETEYLKEGYILSIDPHTGFVRIVYRPESPHNVLFATDRCNSRCLMCSQPPKEIDDGYLMEEHFKIIELIEDPPHVLGITGGEPTLLGDHVPHLLYKLKESLPDTHVQMLTNGRAYKDRRVVEKFAAVNHPSFISAIPLYGDLPELHDYVVQAPGAFDETVEGIYNAAEAGLAIEIRVVLVRPTLERLNPLVEFLYWNFPFAVHIALMGLEPMGYAKRNWKMLWVEPREYQKELEEAVRFLFWRGLPISIYNFPLCLLPRTLWGFARKSISDFKNIYLEACESCAMKSECCGLFASQEHRHSQAITPIPMEIVP